MENDRDGDDYITVWIAPEIGDKIWGQWKNLRKGFLYYNHVLNSGMCNERYRTSGGLEINFG